MSIAAIEPITLGRIGAAEHATPIQTAESPAFMKMLGGEVQRINESLNGADAAARSLAAGDGIPVHDVTIAMEHAHLKLQFAVEVRNRLLDAYQNLTNMQL